MSTSLDNIWDEPAAAASPRTTVELDKTNTVPLFLRGDSDDEGAYSVLPQNGGATQFKKSVTTFKAANGEGIDPEIEALFDLENDINYDVLDEAEPLKAIDTARLEQEALARYKKTSPSQLPSSSSAPGAQPYTGEEDKENKAKERRKIVRLDEALLMGPTGFPRLVKYTKDFKIKGKGHEAHDLNRLLKIYQFWTHEMYSKTTFRETVVRVEKLTHSKRLNVALSVWRDQTHGTTLPRPQNIDSNSDHEDAPPPTRGLNPSDLPRPTGDHSNQPALSPPEIEDEFGQFDDIEALMQAEDAAVAALSKAPASFAAQPSNANGGGGGDMDVDDDELYEIMRAMQHPPLIASQPSPRMPSHSIDEMDDAEMQDLLMEGVKAAEVQQQRKTLPDPTIPVTNDSSTTSNTTTMGFSWDDEDDIY